VSDEFTVLLCGGHHRELHQIGNEQAWWEDLQIDALEVAKGFGNKAVLDQPRARQHSLPNNLERIFMDNRLHTR